MYSSHCWVKPGGQPTTCMILEVRGTPEDDKRRTYKSPQRWTKVTSLNVCLVTFCLWKFRRSSDLNLIFFSHRECLKQTVLNCLDAEVKCPYADQQYSCNCTLQDREIKTVSSTQALKLRPLPLTWELKILLLRLSGLTVVYGSVPPVKWAFYYRIIGKTFQTNSSAVVLVVAGHFSLAQLGTCGYRRLTRI